MGQIVTLEVSEAVALSAREVARQTSRSLEAVLLEWLDRAASDLPVELLSDQAVRDLRETPLGASTVLVRGGDRPASVQVVGQIDAHPVSHWQSDLSSVPRPTDGVRSG